MLFIFCCILLLLIVFCLYFITEKQPGWDRNNAQQRKLNAARLKDWQQKAGDHAFKRVVVYETAVHKFSQYAKDCQQNNKAIDVHDFMESYAKVCHILFYTVTFCCMLLYFVSINFRHMVLR